MLVVPRGASVQAGRQAGRQPSCLASTPQQSQEPTHRARRPQRGQKRGTGWERAGGRDWEGEEKSWSRFAVEIRARDPVGSCFPGGRSRPRRCLLCWCVGACDVPCHGCAARLYPPPPSPRRLPPHSVKQPTLLSTATLPRPRGGRRRRLFPACLCALFRSRGTLRRARALVVLVVVRPPVPVRPTPP